MRATRTDTGHAHGVAAKAPEIQLGRLDRDDIGVWIKGQMTDPWEIDRVGRPRTHSFLAWLGAPAPAPQRFVAFNHQLVGNKPSAEACQRLERELFGRDGRGGVLGSR